MSEYAQLATADEQAEEIARLPREIERLDDSSEPLEPDDGAGATMDEFASEPRGAGAAMVDDRESWAWTEDDKSVSENEEHELATIRVRTMYG
jgi:hypothetical protein